MDEGRRMVLRRRPERFEDFEFGGAGRVLEPKADPETTRRQAGIESLLDLGNLLRGGLVSPAAPGRQEGAGIVHDRHPGRDVADRRAKIDQRLAGPVGVELRHVAGADLEFERRGHAVHREDPVVLIILAVGMEVDEARGHDQPLGVDHGLGRQGRG